MHIILLRSFQEIRKRAWNVVKDHARMIRVSYLRSYHPLSIYSQNRILVLIILIVIIV